MLEVIFDGWEPVGVPAGTLAQTWVWLHFEPPEHEVTKSEAMASVEPNSAVSAAVGGEGGQVPDWQKWSPSIVTVSATTPLEGVLVVILGRTLKLLQTLVFKSLRVKVMVPV
ncbi:MAG: hypothetical protein A3J48_00940 [Candidatus Doudnabacteria bacterium RIFCSPHIGHO2_02_FULL_46_11]|uniref:Uncharacterized protein n=1 Tax=Candidatus Doudnabacteria bacterium RIFCSPHIGHO2_02_FULL_46_11 TaxID=1817832 RepID=A0A1F5P7G9_9BACT|nr:MAG: hypothetical protein A3J48_00940 [Candidatus Doudnabacteria bacterium RIFCSPHIGHO2_02_FULL_46_11]